MVECVIRVPSHFEIGCVGRVMFYLVSRRSGSWHGPGHGTKGGRVFLADNHMQGFDYILRSDDMGGFGLWFPEAEGCFGLEMSCTRYDRTMRRFLFLFIVVVDYNV